MASTFLTKLGKSGPTQCPPKMKHKQPSTLAHRGRGDLPSCRLKGFSNVNSSFQETRHNVPSKQPHLSRLSAWSAPSFLSSITSPDKSLSAFPTYLVIPSIRDNSLFSRSELVKGTTCKLILAHFEDGESVRDILIHLRRQTPDDDSHYSETFFTMEDINSIRIICRGLGLRGSSPLEAATYDSETIERWWEESRWEQELRKRPIPNGVYGGTGNEWWARLEDANHRNWTRTRVPDIGKACGT